MVDFSYMHSINFVDYETNTLNPYSSGSEIFASLFMDYHGDYIISRFDWIDKRKNKVSKDLFISKWEDTKLKKCAHNAKFEWAWTNEYFKKQGLKLSWDNFLHDTMIIEKMVCNTHHDYKLENCIKRLIGNKDCEEYDYWDKEVKKHKSLQKRIFTEMEKKGIYSKKYIELITVMENDGIIPFTTNRWNYGLIPHKIIHPYLLGDGERCNIIFRSLYPILKENKKLHDLYLIELELLKVSEESECTGVMLNIAETDSLIEWLHYESLTAKNEIYKRFGKFNIGSNDQLSYKLFKENNFPIILKSKKTKKPSASKEVLSILKEKTKDPIFDYINKYRAYSKGLVTVKKYKTFANKKGVIHHNIQTNLITGRESIKNPALQTVSKEKSAGVDYPIPARKCFRPHENSILLAPDYSGIELRLIINKANDKELLKKFNDNPDFDMHSYCTDIFTGSAAWRKSKNKYVIRDGMKAYDFGKPFGGNIETTTANLSKYYTLEERIEGDKRFKKAFPNIYNFRELMEREYKEKGYIETAFGRRLYIQRGMEYTAPANYYPQGTAGQIIKIAQIRLRRYFFEQWDNLIKIIFPVHDELLINCPLSIWGRISNRKKIIKDCSFMMTDFNEINIPLAVEWKLIKTVWSEGIKFTEKDIPKL